MDDPLIKRLEPTGIPTGVDSGQYYKRFLENSPRLSITCGIVEHMEVFRMLLKKKCQEQSDSNKMSLMDAVLKLGQVRTYDVLETKIRVGISIHT